MKRIFANRVLLNAKLCKHSIYLQRLKLHQLIAERIRKCGIKVPIVPIRTIVSDSRQYAQGLPKDRDDLSVVLIPFTLESNSERPPPRTSTADRTTSHPEGLRSAARTKFTDCFGLIVKQATIVGRHFSVVSSYGEYFADVSYQLARTPQTADISSRLRAIRSKKIAGDALCLYSSHDNNYFHWLTEILPKVRLAQNLDIYYDHLLIRSDSLYQREILSMLALPLNAIPKTWDFRGLTYDRVIALSSPSRNGEIPIWVVEWLRNIFPPSATQNETRTRKGKRVVVMRSQPGRRAWKNFEECLSLLSTLGFELLYMEEMTFQEQVDRLSAAEVVVGVHGAGLTNLIFAPIGCKVLELFHPGYVNPCYYKLCSTLKHQYFYLLGSRDLPGQNLIYADITIDRRILAESLKNIVEG